MKKIMFFWTVQYFFLDNTHLLVGKSFSGSSSSSSSSSSSRGYSTTTPFHTLHYHCTRKEMDVFIKDKK